MVTSSARFEIVRQIFNALGSIENSPFLKSFKSNIKLESNFTFPKRIKVCSHYKSTTLEKYKKSRNTKRFICKNYHKTFITSGNMILFKAKRSVPIENFFIHCPIKKFYFKKDTQIYNINTVNTNVTFNWQYNIPEALRQMQKNIILSGIVKCDETFMPISHKECHMGFNFPDSAKYCGTTTIRYSLLKNLPCMPYAINLSIKLERKSIFSTANLSPYLKLSNKINLNHSRISQNNYPNRSFNIQVNNNYHIRLEPMITYNFKSVSSKYLNYYHLCSNHISFPKESRKKKGWILFRNLPEANYLVRCANIIDRHIMPLLVA